MVASRSLFILLFLLIFSWPILPNAQDSEDSSEEPSTTPEANPAPDNFLIPTTEALGRAATIQVLNKITARTSNLEIRAGTSEKFGNIKVKIKDCWKAPPEEKPEVATLLEISEEKKGEDVRKIFHGWMFASSPAISALEHPVYDIVILDCKPWQTP